MTNKVELSRLAEQGNVEAQYRLGAHYEDEEKNIPEACKWYERAARQDHTESQFCLGYYYYFGDKGFPANIEKSIHWYKKAAQKGHTQSQRRLGDVYRRLVNFTEAVQWYEKAVVKKDKMAMFYLAKLNEMPDSFPGSDVNIAVSLYEELSDDPFNDKGAMVNLALLYCYGSYIARNATRGKNLIEKCNLVIDGKVQLYDEISIYELYSLGLLYTSGWINANKTPDIDDLYKGILLLDIAIEDGLSGINPENIELAKKSRGLAVMELKSLNSWTGDDDETFVYPVKTGQKVSVEKLLNETQFTDAWLSEYQSGETSDIIKQILIVEACFRKAQERIGQLEKDYISKQTDLKNRKEHAEKTLFNKREKLIRDKENEEKRLVEKRDRIKRDKEREETNLVNKLETYKRFKETQGKYIDKVHRQIEIEVTNEKRKVITGLKNEYEHLKEEWMKTIEISQRHIKSYRRVSFFSGIRTCIGCSTRKFKSVDHPVQNFVDRLMVTLCMIITLLLTAYVMVSLSSSALIKFQNAYFAYGVYLLTIMCILTIFLRMQFLNNRIKHQHKKMTTEFLSKQNNVLNLMTEFRNRYPNCFNGELFREPPLDNFRLNLSASNTKELVENAINNTNYNPSPKPNDIRLYSFSVIPDKVNKNMEDYINDYSAEYLADIDIIITEINNETEAFRVYIENEISKINNEIAQKNNEFKNEENKCYNESHANRKKIIDEVEAIYHNLISAVRISVDEYRVVSSTSVTDVDEWRINIEKWEQLPDRLLEKAKGRKYMDHLLAGRKTLNTVIGNDVFLPVFIPWQNTDGNMPGHIIVRYNEGGKDTSIALVNNLLMRMFATFDAGCIRFSFIDPLSSGDSRYMINKLSVEKPKDINVRLFYEKTKTSSNEIGEHLRLLKNKMEEVQKGVGFAQNIIEYNLDNNNASDSNRPYEVIVVYNFHKFGSNYMEHLHPIIEYGCRWGFYLIAICPQITGDSHFRSDTESLLSSRKFIRFQIKGNTQALHRLEYYNSLQQIEMKHDFWLLDNDISLPNNAKEGLVASNPFSLNSTPIDNYFGKVKEILKTFLGDNRSKSNLIRFKDDYHIIEDEFSVPIGEAANNVFEFKVDQMDSAHTFILGKTGSGKSVLLHDIVTATVLKYSPCELQLYLMDFKKGGVEFISYTNVHVENDKIIPIPHIRAALLDDCDLQIAVEVLEDIVKEMRVRSEKLNSVSAKKLAEYNTKVKDKERLPSILIVIDECQKLFGEKMTDRQKRINAIMVEIAREGRNQGIHLIFATQTLVGTDIPDNIIRNIANKYILKSDKTDAGRFLYQTEKLNMLEKQGSAIYIRHNEQPQLIQPDYLVETQINEWLKLTIEKSKKLGMSFVYPFIFSGKQTPYLDEVEDYEWSDKEPMTLGRTIKVECGLTNIPIHKRDGGRHLLVIGNMEKQRGQAENNALRIIVGSMFSLAQHYKKTGKPFKIYIINRLDKDENKNVEILNSFACDNIVFLENKKAVEKTFLELIQQIDDNDVKQEDTYLYIIGQHKFRDLINNVTIETPTKQDSQIPDSHTSVEYLKVEAIDFNMGFGYTPTSSTKSLSYKSCLEKILKNGNDFGIHVVLHVDSLSRLFIEDSSYMKDLFRYMAILSMPERDTERLTKTNDKMLTEELSSDPERVRAFFFEDTSSEYPAFVPFVLPSKEFIKQYLTNN